MLCSTQLFLFHIYLFSISHLRAKQYLLERTTLNVIFTALSPSCLVLPSQSTANPLFIQLVNFELHHLTSLPCLAPAANSHMKLCVTWWQMEPEWVEQTHFLLIHFLATELMSCNIFLPFCSSSSNWGWWWHSPEQAGGCWEFPDFGV